MVRTHDYCLHSFSELGFTRNTFPRSMINATPSMTTRRSCLVFTLLKILTVSTEHSTCPEFSFWVFWSAYVKSKEKYMFCKENNCCDSFCQWRFFCPFLFLKVFMSCCERMICSAGFSAQSTVPWSPVSVHGNLLHSSIALLFPRTKKINFQSMNMPCPAKVTLKIPHLVLHNWIIYLLNYKGSSLET